MSFASLIGARIPHPVLVPPETAVAWDPTAATGSWTFSLLNRSAAYKPQTGNPIVVSDLAHSTGKRYAEIKYSYTAAYAADVHHDVGITRGLTGSPGANLRGIGVAYNRTGEVFREGTDLGALAAAIGNGSTVMLAVDFDNLRCWLGVGGVWATGDPSTLTSPTVTGMAAGIYRLAGCYESANVNYNTYVVAGNSADILYPVPTGFSVWGA